MRHNDRQLQTLFSFSDCQERSVSACIRSILFADSSKSGPSIRWIEFQRRTLQRKTRVLNVQESSQIRSTQQPHFERTQQVITILIPSIKKSILFYKYASLNGEIISASFIDGFSTHSSIVHSRNGHVRVLI